MEDDPERNVGEIQEEVGEKGGWESLFDLVKWDGGIHEQQKIRPLSFSRIGVVLE